jgi:hypothetical protein
LRHSVVPAGRLAHLVLVHGSLELAEQIVAKINACAELPGEGAAQRLRAGAS